jgi:hypothetical protein
MRNNLYIAEPLLPSSQLTQSHAKISSPAEILQNLTKVQTSKSALLPKKSRHEFYRLAVVRPYRACRQFDDLSTCQKGSRHAGENPLSSFHEPHTYNVP